MSLFAEIILPIPVDEGFTYLVPENLQETIQPGSQVIIPFQKRHVSGIVLKIEEQPPAGIAKNDLKEITDVVFGLPVVSPELMQLLQWIATYYICSLGEAYRLLHFNLNTGTSRLMIRHTARAEMDDLSETQLKILGAIPPDRAVSYNILKKQIQVKSVSDELLRLERLGFVERKYEEIKAKKPQKTEDYFSGISPDLLSEAALQKFQKIASGKSTRTRELLLFLSDSKCISFSELKLKGFSRNPVNRLLEWELIKKETWPVDRLFDFPYKEDVPQVNLTPEQENFVNRAGEVLESGEFKTFLLHGITGSGKTQIYIELIQKTLEKNRQAIVLVPEIVLTPQTIARFRAYFGKRVIALHSRLSPGERREILYKIRQGAFEVIIGPRSAIFAPVLNLGLVVIDEEQEASYKQSDSQPRYHARDVAIYRARLNRAVVVLGSATPSFESLFNANQGLYEYHRLTRRIEKRKLPRIALIDLKEDWKKSGQQPLISQNLELKIESRLLLREQIMIFQNRRGYSPYILCKECGYVAKCKNCDITLTYHQKNHSLQCHYCDYREKAPDVCPQCGGVDLVYRGIGTQRLEEKLNEQFSHAKVLRMDQDTTRGKHGHSKILEKFRNEEADILLGTQMIAKGLDFEKVSLVGIISADQGLHFPDFRSTEKTFQLLTQAAGRAGRGEQPGEVVVQTYDPAHYIYNYLNSHNYDDFYKRELESRRTLSYPPFSRLMLIKIEGQKLGEVQSYSSFILKFLWKANTPKSFSILGPAPAPIAKIKNLYRYQILIKQEKSQDRSMSRLRHVVRQGLYLNKNRKKWPVKIVIDVDPIDII